MRLLSRHNPIWAWFHRAITPHAQPVQSCDALPWNVRQLRHKKGWSIRQLATESGVSESTILQIEFGLGLPKRARYPDPLLSTLLKLARALEVGIEELVKEGQP